MYAVIETGGKQYRVELGNEIEVERLDVEPGQSIDLEQVLLVADGDDTSIGRPVVDGAIVRADVLRQDRGEKIVVFKYKPKTRRRVKQGHRQDLTVLRIADIRIGGRSAAQDAAAEEAKEQKARQAAEKEAARRAAADKALAAKLAEEAEKAEADEAAKAKPARGRTRKPVAAAPGADEAAPSDETAAPVDETEAPTRPARPVRSTPSTSAEPAAAEPAEATDAEASTDVEDATPAAVPPEAEVSADAEAEPEVAPEATESKPRTTRSTSRARTKKDE